jgi:hypothetical protein
MAPSARADPADPSRAPSRAAARSAAAPLAALVRLPDWWHYKLPPLFGIGYLLLAGPPVAPVAAGAELAALFLLTSLGTGAFGHLVNDWSDLEADRRAGAPSRLSRLSPAARAGVTLAALALALAPWLRLPPEPTARALFAAEFALFAAYSLPPLRLKERGAAGVVADALYGHALPMGVAATLFAVAGGRASIERGALVALVTWKLAQGLCGAIASQLADRRADRRSGTRSFVLGFGPLAARRLLLRVLLPVQLAAFVWTGLALAPRAPWLLPAWGIFLAATLWKIHVRWRRGLGFYRRGYSGYALLNDFHERWLPLAALAALVAAAPGYAPLALLHLLVFRTGLGDLARALRRRSARP